MDLNALIPYAVGMLIVFAALIPIVMQGRMLGTPGARKGYGAALRALCDELGLTYEPVESFFDRASGRVGGSEVTFEYDIPDSSPVLVVSVSTSSLPDELVIRRIGAKLHRDEPVGERQRTRDAELDAKVEIAGAPEVLLAAIRANPALRALIAKVACELGAVLVAREFQLTRPAFPTSADTLRSLVTPLIELSSWLARPEREPAGSALGTRQAARLRPLDDLRGQARMDRLVEFFDAVGVTLGGGRSYPNAAGDSFEWRGQRGTRPLRIEVAWSGTVELAIKVRHGFGNVWFTYDPDVVESVQPPKWDEDAPGRVFVGPSTFVEGFGGSDAELRGRLARLPVPLAKRVAAQIRADEVRYFRLESDEVTAMFWPDVHEMQDPEGQILRTIELAGACADFLGGFERVSDGSDDEGDDDDDDADDADDDHDDETDAPDETDDEPVRG